MNILIDSSVLLDLLTDSSVWAEWSELALDQASTRGALCINDTVWSECSAAYERIEDYQVIIRQMGLVHLTNPKEALFLAAKAFVKYRGSGGTKIPPLPDFYIGAHAAVSAMPLLTRDPRRIRTHFPSVELIAPS